MNPLEHHGDAAHEMALWVAVLNQAVKDAEMLIRKVEKDATLWDNPSFRSEVFHLKRFFRKQSMEPGGFGFLCTLLGMNADRALRCIEEKYLQHLKKPINRHSTRVDMLLTM